MRGEREERGKREGERGGKKPKEGRFEVRGREKMDHECYVNMYLSPVGNSLLVQKSSSSLLALGRKGGRGMGGAYKITMAT